MSLQRAWVGKWAGALALGLAAALAGDIAYASEGSPASVAAPASTRDSMAGASGLELSLFPSAGVIAGAFSGCGGYSAVDLGVGWRVSPVLYVGLSGGAGTQLFADSAAHQMFAVGPEVRFHLRPEREIDPWLGLAGFYEGRLSTVPSSTRPTTVRVSIYRSASTCA